MRLLVTRPQPNAAQTAVALRAHGHEPIVAPLSGIEILASAHLGAGPWAAFLLTSAHSIWGLAGHAHRPEVRDVPVFAVGERTAQAIRDSGFTAVTSADGHANDLADLVARRLNPPARLLYLAAEDRSGDLAGNLRARGFVVDTVVVYRAVVVARLPDEAAQAVTRQLDGVLHFSRRSAEIYVTLAETAGLLAGALQPVQFCLSAQVAEPLVRAGARTIRIASRPTAAALLALIAAEPGPGTGMVASP